MAGSARVSRIGPVRFTAISWAMRSSPTDPSSRSSCSMILVGVVYQHINPAVQAPNSLLERQNVQACGNVAAKHLNRRIPHLEFAKCRFIARAGRSPSRLRHCEP